MSTRKRGIVGLVLFIIGVILLITAMILLSINTSYFQYSFIGIVFLSIVLMISGLVKGVRYLVKKNK